MSVTEIYPQASTLITKYRVTNKVNEPQKQAKKIEVYLFCPDIESQEHKQVDQHFFYRQLANLRNRLACQPIFLDKESAVNYAQFINSNHAILKAYIDEAAIEGHSHHKLVMRQNALVVSQIHGCFLPTQMPYNFYKNPLFDEAYLS